MKVLAKISLVLLLTSAGCTATLKNQGELGMRVGMEYTLFHRAAKTADEPAVSNLDVPSVEEMILRDATAEE